jgi:hypothetical protein
MSQLTLLQEHLGSIDACWEAREWAGTRTAQQAWDECERADWLLWWAWMVGRDNRAALIRATCRGPRRALRFVTSGELHLLRAIEAAEAVAAENTPKNRAAAAWAAALAAAAAATGDAAWAAALAAAAAWDSARAAARAAAWAVGAAAAATGDAAWAASAAAARAAEHIAICQEIRAILSCPVKETQTRGASCNGSK